MQSEHNKPLESDKIYYGEQNILYSGNNTDTKEWKKYCNNSPSNHIIFCPKKILQTINNEWIHKINTGFIKYRNKLDGKETSESTNENDNESHSIKVT